MYNSSLAVAVKVNGKVLREFNKDTVYLPFGSEYSLLIKNLNSVRSIVNITIDGQNMTKNGLIVNAYSEVELERKITDNMSKGNKFKFIERNDAVEAHRGIKIEDGLIRIEYQFEKVYNYQPLYYVAPRYDHWTNYPLVGSGVTTTFSASGSSTSATSEVLRSTGMNNIAKSTFTADFESQALNDAGITVPGSESNQTFREVSDFPLDPAKHVMIFKLLGETADNLAIRKPVTVKHKPKCSTCGKQNKAHAKFCSACGTALHVIA